MLLATALFLLSIIVLTRSSIYLVRTLTKLAVYFKLSEFSVAFILMAVATSLPELSVGIDSALGAKSALSLGTVLGSNIINLTLIIGLPAIIARGLRIESKIRNRDLFYTIVLSTVPLVLLIDGTLSRADGAVLLLLFLLYLYRMLYQRDVYTKKLNHWRKDRSLTYYLMIFVVEFILLVASAHYLVTTAAEMAINFGLPLTLVGAAVIALGTSLPELSFELYAVRRHDSGLALGNILGSVVTNSLLVLGVTSLITPIIISGAPFILTLSITWLFVVTIFGIFMRSQYKLTAEEGLILVFLYVVIVLTQFTALNSNLIS